VIVDTYKKNNLKGIAILIKDYSKKVFCGLSKCIGTADGKATLLKDILSAFGYGLPYLSRDKGSISLTLIRPSFAEDGFESLMLQGFLEEAYSKGLTMKSIIKIQNKVRLLFTISA
jgi:thermostable 8-oxoguanine DNA glycosylase